MKKLSNTATLSAVTQAAAGLGFEVDQSDDLYHLWSGDLYKGGFSDLGNLIDDLNTKINWRNDAIAEEQALEGGVAALTKCFSDAVILKNGEVVGTCQTAIKNGGKVAVARARTANGEPVNVQYFTVSRAKKNFSKAKDERNFSYFIFKGDIYYE